MSGWFSLLSRESRVSYFVGSTQSCYIPRNHLSL